MPHISKVLSLTLSLGYWVEFLVFYQRLCGIPTVSKVSFYLHGVNKCERGVRQWTVIPPRVYSHLMPCVTGISSGCAVNLTRIKCLMEMNEWINGHNHWSGMIQCDFNSGCKGGGYKMISMHLDAFRCYTWYASTLGSRMWNAERKPEFLLWWSLQLTW